MSKKTRKKKTKKVKKSGKDSRDWSAFNKKIAAMRGVEWRKKVMTKKAKGNPSLMQIQRISKGKSRRDIADELGLRSVTSILRIERGISPVTRKRAEAISTIIESTPKRVFRKVPYKNKFFVIKG